MSLLSELIEHASEFPHLEEALTHPSYANEKRAQAIRHNQRLEFLGDSVLGLCVSEALMSHFPEAEEGSLSLMRSSLVNTEALATWARDADLGSHLRLGRGADAAGERDQTNVLADAVEAIVGATYLDRGLNEARRLTLEIIRAPFERLLTGPPPDKDAKSALQQLVQAQSRPTPRYRVIEVEGPAHNREFLVEVESGGTVIGRGRGRSKKLAEQAAARDALEAETKGTAP